MAKLSKVVCWGLTLLPYAKPAVWCVDKDRAIWKISCGVMGRDENEMSSLLPRAQPFSACVSVSENWQREVRGASATSSALALKATSPMTSSKEKSPSPAFLSSLFSPQGAEL